MKTQSFIMISLLLTFMMGGKIEVNSPEYQVNHKNEAGFDQLYITDEKGLRDVVYRMDETILPIDFTPYQQRIDYLNQVKNPYVRNIASLLYTGYPTFKNGSNESLDYLYHLRVEDEYEFKSEAINKNDMYTHVIQGSTLAYVTTQRALSDCLALYKNDTLDTRQKFNEAVEQLKSVRREEYQTLAENQVYVYRDIQGQEVSPQLRSKQAETASSSLSSFYEALIDSAIYLQVNLVNEHVIQERLICEDSELRKVGKTYQSGLFSIDTIDGAQLRYQIKNNEVGVEIYDHLHGLVKADTWLKSGENIEIVSDHDEVELAMEYEFVQRERIVYYSNDTKTSNDLIGIGETTNKQHQTFAFSLNRNPNTGTYYLIALIVFSFAVALLSIYMNRRKQK